MRAIRVAFVAAAMTLLLSSPAQAWNAAGHRLSAAIAWRQLDDAARERIGHLLERHPDYPVWIARSKKLEPGYAAFLEASTWPDDIRRDTRFHDDGDEPTPTLKEFPDMSRHRAWHHIDRPIGHTPARVKPGRGQLDVQLERLAEQLDGHRRNTASRAYALPWLMHLIADAHQPLHAVSHYDSEGESDEGGNGLMIENPFHPRRSSMSLHAYWDDLPGPPWLRGERLEQSADHLAAAFNAPAQAGEARKWLDESERLARQVVYDGLDGTVPTLSAAYHERAQRIARERVAQAGYRMGLLLQRLFGDTGSPASNSR